MTRSIWKVSSFRRYTAPVRRSLRIIEPAVRILLRRIFYSDSSGLNDPDKLPFPDARKLAIRVCNFDEEQIHPVISQTLR